VEKYFEKHCSREINSALRIRAYYSTNCFDQPLSNMTMALFDNPRCEGKPLQEKVTDTNHQNFLLRVEHTEHWSVRVSKERFKTYCHNIGMMIPYQYNQKHVYLRQWQNEEIVPTASIGFSWSRTQGLHLSTNVFIQSTPYSCTNSSVSSRTLRNSTTSTNPLTSTTNPSNIMSSQKYEDYDFYLKNPEKKRESRQWGSGSGSGCWGGTGSGSGSGSGWLQDGCNWKCKPTCQYDCWSTSGFPCKCKGVKGAGRNQSTTGSVTSYTGRIDWYDEEDYLGDKYFTIFAEFSQSKYTELRVCTSNLSITWTSQNTTEIITKDVPCFTKPTQRTISLPTFPGEVGSTTASPLGAMSWKIKPPKLDLDSSLDLSALGSGSDLPWPSSYPHWLAKTKVDYKDMFTETEDVLIWGGSDRFWIVGCTEKDSNDKFITFDVDFFTSKEPRATPEFCGCILNTLPDGTSTASKEHVISCYDIALHGGPAPRRRRRSNRKKLTRTPRKPRTRKGRKGGRRHGNRRPSWTRQNKQNLKNLKNMKRPTREKRDVSFNTDAYDEELLNGNTVEAFEDEDDFDDYDDDNDNISSGWD